jgi:2-polyprenyl-6-methoxyphenol hydroxylase-like FAD-dependent oxidoreductase
MLLVNRYQSERVFLVGDAAHLNPPWGGHGFNTQPLGDALHEAGVSDAMQRALAGFNQPVLDQVAQQLLHEERVALCLVMHQLDETSRDRLLTDRTCPDWSQYLLPRRATSLRCPCFWAERCSRL